MQKQTHFSSSSRAGPCLVVVGGGAAGFFAAIRAKNLNPHLDVVILESAPKPLGKVKISGGGRCNVTHACFDVERLVQFYPRGQRELKGVFSRFGPQQTVHWFESHGVKLKTEADGRMFPVSDQSQTIIDCLMHESQKAGVNLRTRCPVKSVDSRSGGGFVVQTAQGIWEADFVLLATGGDHRGWTWVERLGHGLIPPVPSLFTFCIDDPLLKGLAGISLPHVKGRLQVPGEKPITQEGAMLITHWGLSGPLILRLSAWGARPLFNSGYHGTLVLDLVPQITRDDLRNRLLTQRIEAPKKQVGNLCPVDVPRRFWERLLQAAQVDPALPWGQVSQKAVNRLSETLKHCVFTVQGKGEFKDEFVTAGGVPLKEIDMKTMESRRVPGLYLAGEIIDVDALTGGFNFQNAWSTGWLAGEAVAARAKALV